jgi:enoyl-CoA hydratase/carnithine racemase
MLFTGEAISADEALQHGLISEIVTEDKLESRVDEIAELINSNSKSVISLGMINFFSKILQLTYSI